MRKTFAFNRIMAFALVMVMVIIMVPTHFFPQAADDDTPRTSNMFIRSGDVSVEGNLQRGTTLAASKVADPFTSAALRSSTKSLNGVIRSGASVNGITPAPVSDEPEILTYSQLNYLGFYDISLRKGGADVQPAGQVKVTIKNIDLSDAKGANIIHILDSADAIRDAQKRGTAIIVKESAFVNAFPAESELAKQVTGENGAIVIEETAGEINEARNAVTFYTNSFSIFAISDEPILTVNFYKGAKSDANKIVSIRVKARDASDAAEFERIIYDPGINETLPDDVLFRGWFESNDYTVEDAEYYDAATQQNKTNALTIAQVREIVSGILNADGFNGGTKDFYAMLYKRYMVTYFDQAGKVCLGRDFVLQRADNVQSQIDYQVTLDYVPYGQFENFEGWKLMGNDYESYKQNLVGIYPGGDDNGPSGTLQTDTVNGTPVRQYVYKTPTWTRISGDIYLIADSPAGNWLVFKENGKGGTYVAPQFVKNGQSTVDPENNGDESVVMQRYGYVFGGWYYFPDGDAPEANSNGVVDLTNATQFTFGSTITENITLYAKWTPKATANYTVIIWRQNVAGNDYDFAESVTIVGTVGTNIGTVTSSGTGNNAYATVNGSPKRYTGFHLKEYDQNVEIVPEGTAILNVYYDRNIVTLTFQHYSNGSDFSITTDTTGEIYGYVDGDYVRVYYDANTQTWYTIGSTYVETTDYTEPLYGYVGGEYILLSKSGDVWYYINSEQYAPNEIGSPKFGIINGQYVQLIERDGNYYYISGTEPQYVSTTNYYSNETKYAILNRTDTQLIDGVFTELSYYSGTYFLYYVYTASNATGREMYGLIDGKYVLLTRQNNGGNRTYWYNNVQYTGQRYTRIWSNYTRWDSTTIYVRREVDVETEYTGTVYTHAIPYTGPYYKQQEAHIPYTGNRYKSDGVAGWKTIHILQGLYGAPLSSSTTGDKAWPTDYWYYDGYQNGYNGLSGSGTRTTFLDAFILSSGASDETYYGFTATGTRTVNFYKWDGIESHFDRNNPNNTAITSNGTFNISDKYNGYRAYQYSTNGTTWTDLPASPGTNGYYGSVETYTTLYIRFVPRQYNIVYMDGQYVDGNGNPVAGYSSRGKLGEVDGVNYDSDLTSYNKGGTNYFVPDDYEGFVFEGWYLDDACTHPYTFTTMSEGVKVYAKWRQIQYRVFLHPNAGSVEYDENWNIVEGTDTRDDSLDWGSESQAMNFRISYGGTISVPKGLRDEYEFAGWFTDPGLTKSFIPATELNETTVKTPYDKTTDLTDYMDQWGVIGPDGDNEPYNSDLTGYKPTPESEGEDRFWITKKIDLYAKWRAKIVGADGMYVKFVTTDPDINNDNNANDPRVGHFPNGTANTNSERTEYCDGEIYADKAFDYGLAACDPPSSDLHFRYWVVQRWIAANPDDPDSEAGYFEDSDVIVYPGERFDTVYRYAQRVNMLPSEPGYNKPGTEGYDPEKPELYYKYYMVLRAEYTPAVPQDTTIVYDANGGSFTSTPTGYTAATVGGYATLSMPLIVNEAIDILPGSVVTRTGYVFAGWSLERNSDVWLFGGETNYSADNLTTNPTGNDPSNTLYAIWVNETFDVTVDKIINNLLTTAFNGTITFNYEIANNAPDYALVSNGKYTITEFVDTVNNGVTTRSVVSNEYNSTGTVTITFTDGEVSGDLPVIAKVPYGHKLTVTEVAITGFELDSVVNAETTKNAGTLSGYAFTINPILVDDTITFTNTRKMVDLVIEKTVTNAIDYGKTFTYELTFGNYKIDGSSTKTITITTDDTGKGSATLSVPYETAVTVEEKQTDSVPLTPYKIYVNGTLSSNFKWTSTGLTDDTNTVVYTNERLVYKVKIAKIVNSILAADYTNAPYEFNFKYELEGSTVNGTLTATVTANGGNGVYGVYTPAGQTEPQDYIEVPYGAKLTITEALNSDAFTTSYAGTVSGNGKEFVINTVNSDVDVKFTNVRKTVNVKVTKALENFTGAASFPFSATWTVGSQTVTIGSKNLTNGGEWEFVVPYGATVVVTEDGTADVVINGNTYDVSAAFDTVITKVAGDNVTQSGLAGTVTEIKNATEIEFTNTRKMVSATITKELDNNGETDFWSTYEFPIKYTITDVDLASPTEVTLYIKDGVIKTVDNIPFGAVIKVEELTDTTPNGQPSIGQVFIVSGDNGKQIALTESATAFTIKNKRQVSDLTITKAGENLNGRTFMFRINSLNSDYDQIVMIKGAGSVTIKGLQTGYNYEVTEITSWSWEFSETPTVNVVTTGPAVKITSVTGGAQFSFLSEAEVTFTNKEKPTNWLRGEAYAKNTFTRITSEQR